VLNAQVPHTYARRDPHEHLRQLASALGLRGGGVGMLTAADVRQVHRANDGGVLALATVGTDCVGPAAAPASVRRGTSGRPGTINIVVVLPVALADGALVNAVATATEAKAQALTEAGLEGTGTPTDALCICCSAQGRPFVFGGPTSQWGSRLARAVRSAVLEGAR